ncbi:four helix bundle protein [Flavivirga spongiicola]|uniref:Four helix bundle protein n=1 Tax=Flavivirga spongiicola TaxID=421621 RepID=A0ABU7XVX6_9FLAO|nr:four helix bundle protein [Flavivirga sp. MEBiC05379]MDO5979723.1 four helix bundle protein [Flavivirga sp. MEBiC05379]
MRKSNYHFKFEDLTIYVRAMEFGELVNGLVKKFPKEERFELSSQFKRAADSIALNVSEGSSGTDKQFHNYLGNAWHSAHECVSCSSKAQMRNYITNEEDEENRRILTELSKMITTLRVRISKRIK